MDEEPVLQKLSLSQSLGQKMAKKSFAYASLPLSTTSARLGQSAAFSQQNGFHLPEDEPCTSNTVNGYATDEDGNSRKRNGCEENSLTKRSRHCSDLAAPTYSRDELPQSSRLRQKLRELARAQSNVFAKTQCTYNRKLKELEGMVEFWKQKATKLEEIVQSLSTSVHCMNRPVIQHVSMTCQTDELMVPLVSSNGLNCNLLTTHVSPDVRMPSSSSAVSSYKSAQGAGLYSVSLQQQSCRSPVSTCSSNGSSMLPPSLRKTVLTSSSNSKHSLPPPSIFVAKSNATKSELCPLPSSLLSNSTVEMLPSILLPNKIAPSHARAAIIDEMCGSQRRHPGPSQNNHNINAAPLRPPPPLLPSCAAYAGPPRLMNQQEYRSVITQAPLQACVYPMQTAQQSAIRAPVPLLPPPISTKLQNGGAVSEVVDLTDDEVEMIDSRPAHLGNDSSLQQQNTQGHLPSSQSLPALAETLTERAIKTNHSSNSLPHQATTTTAIANNASINNIDASLLYKTKLGAGCLNGFVEAKPDSNRLQHRMPQMPQLVRGGSAVLPVLHTRPCSSSLPSSANCPSGYPPRVAVVEPIGRSPVPTPMIEAQRKQGGGLVLSWNMLIPEDLQISKYEIMATQQQTSGQQRTLKSVGLVDALPLPMACTLTQFNAGDRYTFYVRALDDQGRVGPLSPPVEVTI